MKGNMSQSNVVNYKVDSIKDVFFFFVWTKYKKITILFFLLYILWIFSFFVIAVDYFLFFISIFLLSIFTSIYLVILWQRAEINFFENFALTNNLSFSPVSNLSSVYGRLFELGDYNSRQIRNVMSGHYLNWPIRIFIYTFSVGQGKKKKTLNNTVLEISFENIVFPHILLEYKNFLSWPLYSRSIPREKNDENISLDRSYNNFKLRASRGYHIEVLQIFSPEILDFLNSQKNKFNIEFSRNKINIFENKVVNNRKDLDELYNVGKKILDSAGFLIDRLRGDFEVLHPHYKNKR